MANESYPRGTSQGDMRLRTKLEAVFNILLSHAVGNYAAHPLTPIFASILRDRPGD
jgi:hypothetical protein